METCFRKAVGRTNAVLLVQVPIVRCKDKGLGCERCGPLTASFGHPISVISGAKAFLQNRLSVGFGLKSDRDSRIIIKCIFTTTNSLMVSYIACNSF
jgi:hypothetical protein